MSFINIKKFFSNTAFVVKQHINDYIKGDFYEKFSVFGSRQEYCGFGYQAVCTTPIQKTLNHSLLRINNHNSFVVFAARSSFALLPVALSGQSFPNTFSTGESS